MVSEILNITFDDSQEDYEIVDGTIGSGGQSGNALIGRQYTHPNDDDYEIIASEVIVNTRRFQTIEQIEFYYWIDRDPCGVTFTVQSLNFDKSTKDTHLGGNDWTITCKQWRKRTVTSNLPIHNVPFIRVRVGIGSETATLRGVRLDSIRITGVLKDAPEHESSECPVTNAESDGAFSNPVGMRLGEKRESVMDFMLKSPAGDLTFQRGFRQSKLDESILPRMLGQGWSHNHNWYVDDSSVAGELYVYLSDGGRAHFVQDTVDTTLYNAKAGATSQVSVDSGSTTARYTLTTSDDQTFTFNSDGQITQREWSNGEIWTYTYWSGGFADGLLQEVTDGYGRSLQFVYHDNVGGVDHRLLWRVGDHTTTQLTSIPVGRYTEYNYVPQKIEDSLNPGTIIDGTQALLSTVRDIRGQVWTYAYDQTNLDTLNWLVRITSPQVDMDGDDVVDDSIIIKDVTYTVNAGAVENITQKLGGVDDGGQVQYAKEIAYAFQPSGNNITTETIADKTLTHEFAGEVYLGTRDALDATQQQALDTNYRPMLQEDAYGAQTNMGWSADGKNLESVTDALGNATNFTYDPATNLLQTSVDADGRITSYTYDDSDTPRQSSVIEVFDIDGTTLLRKQTFDYDDKGRVLEEVVLDPENNAPLQKTTHTYHTSGNGNGLLKRRTQWDVTGTLDEQVTDYTYDALGRLVKTQKSSLTGTCQFSYTVYDDADQVLGTACGLVNASPIPSNVTELLALYDVADTQKKHTNITLYTYDALGRRVSTTTRAGSTQAREQRTIYDALNRPVRVIQNYVDYSYAAPGSWVFENGVWKDTPGGQAISMGADLDENLIMDTVYNARGLVRLRRDALGNVTLYGYDVADRLIKTVQFASQPDYNNDTDGDVALASYVASGAIDADQISTQAYDANGNIVRREDVLGRVSLTGYDLLNRPVRQIQNASQPDYDWTQDRALADYGTSTPLSLSPDEDLISETVYDNMGRKVENRRLLENRGSAGEIWDTMRMVYDEWGRPKYQIAHYVPQATDPQDWLWHNQRWEDGSDPTNQNNMPIDHGTDNDQNIISQTMYDAEGRAYMTRDVLGKLQRTTYDGLGRPVLSIQNYVEQGSSLPEAWKWENQRWEDGDANPIDHGTNNDQNIIQQTEYDPDQRPHLTRNVQGDESLTVYDAAGRTDKQIQRYVSQGNVTAWAWSETNQRWEDGASNPIDRGDNNNHDQNVIQATAYDDEQRVQSTRDVRGNVTRMVYDEAGRVKMRIQNYVLQGVSEPEDWGWNDTLSQWEDGASNPIDHGTDLDVNRIQSTEFDRAGRVISTRDTVGRVQYHVYDVMGRRTLSVQNYVVQGASTPDAWLWDETQSRWEDGAGNAIEHGTDNDQNLITQTSYNIAGQVVTTRDTRGTRTDYIYDDAGRRVSVVQAVGTKLASQSYTCYDKAGRVRRTIANYVANGNDPDAWQTDAVETWLFVQSTHRYREDNLIATTSYDAASRRQSSTSPMGNIQSLAYDVAGRVVEVTDARGIITHYSYDGLGRRTQVVQNRTLANPEAWVWNDTLSQWEDGATNPIAHGTNNDENIIVQVTYDVMGRVLTMRNPLGNVTTYAYDGLGRRTSLSNPLGLQWLTAYADVGNTTQTTQTYPGANDSTAYDVTRTFDRRGRLTGIQYGDTASTPDVALEYDLAGNRSRMSETDSTTTIHRDYAYDAMNRLKAAGESGAQVNYTYDAGGLRTQMTLPDGLSLDYAYDAKGQLISMTDWDGGKSTFRYDNLGRHTRTYRPNAMQSRYRYDADGRLRDLRHHQGDETLAQFQYEVDANGNRTEAREYLMPASAGNATQTYAYNHPDISFPHGTWVDEGHFKVADGWASWLKVRLVANSISFTYGTGPDHSLFDVYVGGSLWQSVDAYATERGEATLTIPLRYDGPLDFEIRNREEKNLQSTGYIVRFKQVQATSKLATHNISYTYDGLARLLLADYGATQYQYGFDVAGNLVNMNGTSRTFNTANQMTHDGTNTLTYDANGNMINDGVNAYTWDRANRLTQMGTTTYAYDGDSNRISQNALTYILDTQPGLTKVLGDSNGNRYMHSPRGIHAMYGGADWSYAVQDGLGSVRMEVGASVSASQNYTPYGEVMDVNGGFDSPFGFTGEQTDSNGQVYLRARYYNPSMGMFSALDPFEGMHNRPMSLNGYSWVEGNPVMNTDASGRCVDNMVLGNLSGNFLLGNRSANLARLIGNNSR
jgi:RHS repeat-associated protein